MKLRKLLSHLTRGAWIEILTVGLLQMKTSCRTSHEVRGLKYTHFKYEEFSNESHLTRGAWIEIKEVQK